LRNPRSDWPPKRARRGRGVDARPVRRRRLASPVHHRGRSRRCRRIPRYPAARVGGPLRTRVVSDTSRPARSRRRPRPVRPIRVGRSSARVTARTRCNSRAGDRRPHTRQPAGVDAAASPRVGELTSRHHSTCRGRRRRNRVKIQHELSHRDRERQPVTNLSIVALAEALEQWPQRNEVFGCAADDTREVLARRDDRRRDGLLPTSAFRHVHVVPRVIPIRPTCFPPFSPHLPCFSQHNVALSCDVVLRERRLMTCSVG
jgi:hypothetical protein